MGNSNDLDARSGPVLDAQRVGGPEAFDAGYNYVACGRLGIEVRTGRETSPRGSYSYVTS
jgi:hypothetical protein